jgi:hypothetical protein
MPNVNFLTRIQVVQIYNFAGATLNNLPKRKEDMLALPIANGFIVQITKHANLYKCVQLPPTA